MENVSEMLPIVHNSLRRRYGDLTVISGRGVARGQRVEFVENAERLRCVIKVSSGGRISFARREDGSWSGLSDSDRVVIIGPTSLDGDDLLISMFDKETLKTFFDATYAAQEKVGMGHLPIWLAPFHEEGRGPRGAGDGFGSAAMWSETPSDDVVAPGTTLGLLEALAALNRAVAGELPGAKVEVKFTLQT